MSSSSSFTILCLANSWKPGGRCIAGKVLTNQGFGNWIRPTGNTDSGAITYEERQYKDTTYATTLDVITIFFTCPSPHSYQPENYKIDSDRYWRLVRKADVSEVSNAIDPLQKDLWGIANQSGSGINDQVSLSDAPGFGYSLRLISVSDLQVRVAVENPSFNTKKKARGYFTYSGHRYALQITDPNYRDSFLQKAEGTYDVGKAVLCVSLAEPLNDYYTYKLIAGVFHP